MTHVVKPTRGNPFSGSGLVSLAPHDCGRLYVGGNINANLIGGGIFVNSDNASCAADGGSVLLSIHTHHERSRRDSLKIDGSPGLIVNPGPAKSPNPQAAIAYPPNSLGVPAVPPPPPPTTKTAQKLSMASPMTFGNQAV